MNILVIKGRDAHTSRLISGFSAYGNQVKLVTSYEQIDNSRYDLVLVDPSVNFDPSQRIRYDHLMFYDCEDGPLDFHRGVAYDCLKDKATAYVKMNWVDDDPRDSIPNIGFPLPVYKNLFNVSRQEIPDFTYKNAIPMFVGSPTFIGNYSGDARCRESEGIKSISNGMYNQRIDWLLSLRQSNILHYGGLVFSHSNLSLEWQSSNFGDVEKLSTQYTNYDDFLNLTTLARVCLCPTGHERISWRVFDLMSTGAIIVWTDTHNQKSMIMPKKFITIKDDEDLGTKLLSLQPSYKEIWRDSQENRKQLQLDDESVMNIFKRQYKAK